MNDNLQSPPVTDAKPFKRENRYIVVKRSRYTDDQQADIERAVSAYGVDMIECVVIEADWPEYETVWKMIEARVMGRNIGGDHTYAEGLRDLADMGHVSTEIAAVLRDSADLIDAKDGELAAHRLSATSSADSEQLPADVVRLVNAARDIAFNDWDGDSEEWTVARKELDDASEAFASRVPRDDEPAEASKGEARK